MRISLANIDRSSPLFARINAALERDADRFTAPAVSTASALEVWHREDALHKAIVTMIAAEAKPGVVWLHFANGGKRSKSEAAKLKGMGVVPGAPDLLLLSPDDCGVARAYAIEIKAARGVLSKAQKLMRARFVCAGAEYEVARSVTGARQILRRWGVIEIPREPPDVQSIRQRIAS